MPQTLRLSEPRFTRRRLLVWGGLLALVAAGAAAAWPSLRATTHLTTAYRALAAGNLEAAVHEAEAAQRVQPERAEVQYLLAVANRRSGQLDKFTVHLQRAAELGWSPADVARQQWLATAQRGDLADVKQQLFAAVQAGASDEATEEIYEAFAKGSLSTYQLQDAWMCLDIWLQWRPNAPAARVMRASIHEQLGDYDLACQDYRAALAVLPEHREARLRLGHALMIRRRYDEAQLEFQTLLAAAPDDVEALLGVAQGARLQGNLAEARRQLERALPLTLTAQQRGMALREYGRVLLDEGHADEALEPLTRAAAILPGDAQIHHALGTTLARLGKRDQAQYHNTRMQQLRTQYDRMTEITRRLTTEPANADLRCEAGAIMMDAGLKKEGADWLLTALKCDPRHRRTHELLAEYYAEGGDQTQAGRHRLLAAQGAGPAAAAPPEQNHGT